MSRSKKTIIAIAVVLLMVAIAIGFGVYYPARRPTAKAPPAAQKERVPVVFYTQLVKTTTTEYRSWPTERIMRKVGDAEPEVLAEVGKVGEFPLSYTLSPDKTYLLVNVESKLQKLDLKTKKISDLFIPQRQVLSSTFSPDEKSLFIMDQKYAPTDADYSWRALILDIATRQERILSQGKEGGPYFGTLWRQDGKIIIEESHGEFSTPHYFDLKTNKIYKTPGDYASGFLSESGKAMAAVTTTVSDICNDFSGSAPSVYDIIDPVSGQKLGVVGDGASRTSAVIFSPDDEEVLYSADKPWANRDDCEKQAEKTYYIVNLRTGERTQVADLTATMKKWDADYAQTVVAYDGKTLSWSILVNGQPLVTSDKEMQLITQFYQ